jgi:hypothetical protein
MGNIGIAHHPPKHKVVAGRGRCLVCISLGQDMRKEMNHAEEEFIQMVQDDYSGHVKVEILFDLRNEKRLGFLEGLCAMSIKLLLGKPEIIGSSLEYPVESPAFGIYDPDSDGEMSKDAATGLMVRRALKRTYPGATALLGFGRVRPGV